MKKLFTNTKAKAIMILAAICAAMCSVPVLAESTGSANSAVTSAMQTTANDMVATINSIIPIALTVVGISLVVIAGIKIFRKIINKG